MRVGSGRQRQFMIVAAFFLLLVDIFGIKSCCHSLPGAKALTINSQQRRRRSGQPSQYVGFDLGTSGVRISIVELGLEEEGTSTASTTTPSYVEVYSHAIPWPNGVYEDPSIWMESVEYLLERAKETSLSTLEHVKSICVSGTSASCLLIDGEKNVGNPSRLPPCRMYNFDVVSSEKARNRDPIHGVRALEFIERFAPERHIARSATGSLAKLLSWHDEKPLRKGERLAHQSDYVSLKFLSNHKKCGSQRNERFVCSDWHNCLKLGYDVRSLEWPTWLLDCLESAGMRNPLSVLPAQVVSPGEPMGTVSADVARRLGLNKATVLVGGTTDSNAAFVAATADSGAVPGTAVVSLGSTLAMKQLSTTYVENAKYGVYSHRYPSVLWLPGKSDNSDTAAEAWLAGGASNVGCAVLQMEKFSTKELEELSLEIDPTVDSPLSYYPLTRTGERFPVADGTMKPKLEPKPNSRRDYLHGILQGISTVEKDGFELMAELGATPKVPNQIWTCGGGAQNDMWSQMRQRRLRSALGNSNLRVSKATNVEASFGAAVLAAAHARR